MTERSRDPAFYRTRHSKDAQGLRLVVDDLTGTELFTIRRKFRDAAYEARQNPIGPDQLLSREVTRRLEVGDWEPGATYTLDG